LVLDNCEHLVDACAELAERLLQACPELRILATSREPLRVPGETKWRVEPLEQPGANMTAKQVGDTAAVRLFVERTRAGLPGFALTAGTVTPVARICRGLDGISLALELAAARVPGLGVEPLARRLDECLRLLATGSRTAPARQRTLRAALAWSYDLLDPGEQRVLRGLSVFVGGFSLEAAEAVLGADVPDVLGGLVDKSLVHRGGTEAEPRFGLLETVRAFAQEHATSSERATAQDRHALYFMALAERADRDLAGPVNGWLERPANHLLTAGLGLWRELEDKAGQAARAFLPRPARGLGPRGA
jgi:predicted ATPase